MNDWQNVSQSLLGLPRRAKVLVQVGVDLASSLLALGVAYALVAPSASADGVLHWGLLALGSASGLLIACWSLGAYSAVMRYIDARALGKVALAAGMSAGAYWLLATAIGSGSGAANIAAVYAMLCGILIAGWRVLGARALGGAPVERAGEPVVIYGAGSAGQQLVAALRRGRQFRPVAFVDDRADLAGCYIHGLRIHAPSAIAALKTRGVKRILLAVPSLSFSQRRNLLARIEAHALPTMIMPGMDEIAEGRKRVDELREVQIEDLLGRDPVPAQAELLHAQTTGCVVMVTGAGGSIGSELARQVLALGASKLLLVDACEFALYEIDRQLRATIAATGNSCQVVPLLANVCDERHLRAIFAEYSVDTVYHSAAYKHVPLVEANSISAAHNNINGTERTARSALQAGVQNFVLVSTDKAVRPTSIMGATKRFCELVIQSLAQEYPDRSLSMVRFGNVLGSSGSVVPLFREQIRSGGPITVTHPEVTRYFMTIPEAASLVIQAGAMGKSGEVFVLDMGESVRIRDLAERMVQLCGLTLREETDPPEAGDLAIRYTGLRPGEKLFEELLIGSDPEATTHSRIMKANERTLTPDELREAMEQMRQAIKWRNQQELVAMLTRTVNGFRDAVEQGDTSSSPRNQIVVAPPSTLASAPARKPA